MANGQRYETDWEGLRLVIDAHDTHGELFVYDSAACEVLYAAERMNAEAAKLCAIEFAATARFGPQHNLKAELLAAMLLWELQR
jgi:hypothetical protein